MVALNDDDESDKSAEVQAVHRPSKIPCTPVAQDDSCGFNLTFSETQTQPPAQRPDQETGDDGTVKQSPGSGHGNKSIRKILAEM